MHEHLYFLCPRETEGQKKERGQEKKPGATATVINNYNSGQALQANGQTAGPLGILPLRSKNWDQQRVHSVG